MAFVVCYVAPCNAEAPPFVFIFNHKEERTRLETERLIIRDFVEADFGDVHAYASDPDVVQ